MEELLVSGAPREIYDIPGSLFEFSNIVNNRERTAQAGIDYLFTLFRSTYYRHHADADMIVDHDHPWTGQLLESYNRERHCLAAASVVLRIHEAVVENSTIHCLKDGQHFVLYETFRFPDRPSKSLNASGRDMQEATLLDDNDRSYLYVGSAGSFNYGHWLVDDLPRVKAWVELRERLGVTCVILLPSHGPVMDDIRLQSMRALIDPRIKAKFVSPEKKIRVRNLYFATPVSFHPRIKNPGAIHFVQSRATKVFRNDAEEPFRKLFVARRPPNSRAIINFDTLWPFLQARGFEMIEPEKHSFADQVTLFQQARIVIGQMGAAMTGTLFCRPATNIIYLSPIGWIEPFYLDLAAVAGQQYNILFGPTSEGGDAQAHLSDFTIPLDPLYHRLTFMGHFDTGSSAATQS